MWWTSCWRRTVDAHQRPRPPPPLLRPPPPPPPPRLEPPLLPREPEDGADDRPLLLGETDPDRPEDEGADRAEGDGDDRAEDDGAERTEDEGAERELRSRVDERLGGAEVARSRPGVGCLTGPTKLESPGRCERLLALLLSILRVVRVSLLLLGRTGPTNVLLGREREAEADADGRGGGVDRDRDALDAESNRVPDMFERSRMRSRPVVWPRLSEFTSVRSMSCRSQS